MGDVQLGTLPIQAGTGQSGNLVTLPETWRDSLKPTKQGTITIRVGNRQATAKVTWAKDLEILMSATLREELCVPLATLNAKVTDHTLVLGPCVALYSLPSDQPGKPFGELTAVFADMMPLAEQLGILLYVTLPGDWNWERGAVTAYVCRDKKWVRTTRPIPDLVIPKMTSRPAPWRERIEHDLVQMTHRIPFGMFSNATGDKWVVHNTLLPDPQTSVYLPETYQVQSPQDIETMLKRHSDIYVKPAYGTKGRSIFRLKMVKGSVSVKYSVKGVNQNKSIKRGSVNWLPFLRRTFCGKRLYLVQQTIDLMTSADGAPVDFRWLVQKDGQNRRDVTARVARVGAKRSITTNLHTGGAAVLADDFLRQHGYGEEARRHDLLAQVDEAALKIAKVLEAKAGRIGELGIDFGLTKDGRVYLIEINPRPGRQMLKDTSPKTRILSLLRNLEYAMYVTGFGRTSE